MKYFCYITLLLPQYEKDIIYELVKINYIVESACEDGAITFIRNDCALCILKLEYMAHTFKKKEKKIITAQLIFDDVLSVLKKCKVQYHSLIIHQITDGTYGLGNIVYPKDIDPSGSIQD